MQGIPFNQQGVTGILAKVKTSTRRPLKKQPPIVDYEIYCDPYNGNYEHFTFWTKDNKMCLFDGDIPNTAHWKPKYKIGETVFVETGQSITCSDSSEPELMMMKVQPELLLKITGIKVERLQDISEEDCLKEGLEPRNEALRKSHAHKNTFYIDGHNDNGIKLLKVTKYAKIAFKKNIWHPLPYPPEYQWPANPYVFAYEFEVVS